MAKFNEEMVKAGVMLDGNGLQPSSKGARVRFSGAKRTVIDGPFAETKELIAGYWILEVKSKAEAIEWIKRCPNPHEGESEIEIRQIFELEDFDDSEAVAHHRRLGELVDSARFCCGSVDISNANARAIPREGRIRPCTKSSGKQRLVHVRFVPEADIRHYSDICSPDPPSSAGKSLNFCSPSFIGRTVSP